MDNRNEIREFLVSRRARLTPEQAGVPTFAGQRRVPGLRRSEVAQLAGVSIEYYTGWSVGISPAFRRACWTPPPRRCNSRRRRESTCLIWHEQRVRPHGGETAPERASRSPAECPAHPRRDDRDTGFRTQPLGLTMPEEETQTGAQKIVGDFAPKLVSLTDDVLFADVWKRQELAPGHRSLIAAASFDHRWQHRTTASPPRHREAERPHRHRAQGSDHPPRLLRRLAQGNVRDHSRQGGLGWLTSDRVSGRAMPR